MATGRKFVIITRGRSGSTAVAAELGNHPDIICYGELFYPKPMKRPNFREMYDKHGLDYLSPNEKLFIPYIVYEQEHLRNSVCAESEYHKQYLRYLSERAGGFRPGAAIGFKILYKQTVRQPGILNALKEEGFAFLHLIRRNIVRQTISGMVARKRGLYNEKNFRFPQVRYFIDIEEFKHRVCAIAAQLETKRRSFEQLGMDCIELYYEDYTEDRKSFFSPVFSFLGVEEVAVPHSEFSIMTDRNLRNVVENFDDLRLATMGLDLEDMLEAP